MAKTTPTQVQRAILDQYEKYYIEEGNLAGDLAALTTAIEEASHNRLQVLSGMSQLLVWLEENFPDWVEHTLQIEIEDDDTDDREED